MNEKNRQETIDLILNNLITRVKNLEYAIHQSMSDILDHLHQRIKKLEQTK